MNLFYRRFVFVMPLVAVVCVCTVVIGAKAKPSGADPYTPTKVQWLSVWFNSQQAPSPVNPYGFHMYAQPAIGDPNVIELRLLWGDKKLANDLTRREFAAVSLSNNREVLENMADSLGFSEWLVIREEIVTPSDTK